jgi:hypothetical protein
MSSTVQRFTKVSAVFLVVAAGVLAGCAAPTGGVARQLAAPGSAGWAVCSGGHASRFPEHEEQGRICRPALSLHAIY